MDPRKGPDRERSFFPLTTTTRGRAAEFVIVAAISLIVGASIAFGAAIANADQPKAPGTPCAERAANRIQRRYEATKDLSARFEQVTDSVSIGGGAGGGTSTSRGVVVFAKPGRMRWSYEEPVPSLVVTNGKMLWLFDPAAQEVQRMSATGGGYFSATAFQYILGEGQLLADFEVRAEICQLQDGQLSGEVRLVLIPRQAASYERIGLRASGETGEVLGTSITDLFGNTTHVSFSELRENLEPAADVFEFRAPPGVEVIDLDEVKSKRK